MRRTLFDPLVLALLFVGLSAFAGLGAGCAHTPPTPRPTPGIRYGFGSPAVHQGGVIFPVVRRSCEECNEQLYLVACAPPGSGGELACRWSRVQGEPAR